MNDGYNKLFGTIVTSTVWQEPNSTRIVWITLLALADKHGEVQGSIPGLANVANVTIQEFEAALVTLQSPDRYSRTKEHEGRRLEAVDGGWRLLNHAKYRAILSKESIKASKAAYMRRTRADAKESGNDNSTVEVRAGSGQPKQRQRQSQKQKAKPPVVPLEGDGVAPPAEEPKVKRTFKAFIDGLASGDKAIRAGDPIFGYVDNAGIPRGYLALAWFAFRQYHLDRPDKKQIDWRAVFRNYVRENYLGLWRPTVDGYELTAKGEQTARAMKAGGDA